MEALNEMKIIEQMAFELSKNLERINQAIEECRFALETEKIASDYRLGQIFNARVKHLLTERSNTSSDLAKIKNYAVSRNYTLNFNENINEDILNNDVKLKTKEEKEVISVPKESVSNEVQQPVSIQTPPIEEEITKPVEKISVVEKSEKSTKPIQRKEQEERKYVISEEDQQAIASFEEDYKDEIKQVEWKYQEISEEDQQAIASFEEDYKEEIKGITTNHNEKLENKVKTTEEKTPIKIPDFIQRVTKEEVKEPIKKLENEKISETLEDSKELTNKEEKAPIKIPDFIQKVAKKEQNMESMEKPKKEDISVTEKDIVTSPIEDKPKTSMEEAKKEQSIPNFATISDFSCLYKDGKYTISFFVSKDGHKVPASKSIDFSMKKLLDRRLKETDIKLSSMDPMSSIYKNLDYNLFSILTKFDRGFKTKYAKAYKLGKLGQIANITYDFSGKTNMWDRILYSLAAKQSEVLGFTVIKPNGQIYRKENKTSIKPLSGKLEVNKEALSSVAAVAILALAMAAPVGGIAHKIKENNKKQNKQSKVMMQQDIMIDSPEILENHPIMEGSLIGEKICDDAKNIQEEAKKQAEIEKAKKATGGLGVGEGLLLTSKDEEGNIKYTYPLSKTKTGEGDIVLASEYKSCSRFVISSITVSKDQKELDVITDPTIRTNQIYEQYGKDVDIILGFDGIQTVPEAPVIKNIGYLDLAKFMAKNKVDEQGNEIIAEESTETTESVRYTLEDLDKLSSKENSTTTETTEISEKTEESSSKNEEVKPESQEKDTNDRVNSYNFGLDGKVELVIRDKSGSITSSKVLTETAWGKGNRVDTRELDCDYFKPSYVAVYRGSDVLNIIKVSEKNNINEILNNQYKNYGADISVACNFDGYYNGNQKPTYTRIGWAMIDDVTSITTEDKQELSGKYATKDIASQGKVYKK